MGRKNKTQLNVVIIFTLILVVGVGVLAGYFSIRSTVTAQFGDQDQNLSWAQRIFYPLEIFIYRDKLTSPKDLAGTEQDFEIRQGESVAMVCLRLEQIGMIDDAELLRTYLVYTGLDRHLKSGQFRLSAAMSPKQIAAELMDATPKEVIITVLPGWRIEEIAANVSGSGLSITAEAFINAAYTPTPEQLALIPIEDPGSLEGFLFPGTYMISREAGLEIVFENMLAEFSRQVDETLVDGFTRQELSILEAVTLASIIEKEAVIDEEKPMIASVFYNRLNQGIRLETDPTVQYAIGFQPSTETWWKSPLYLDDLAVDSPYNTYIVYGLPPAPISNPGLDSLRAVAFPAKTPYFFFRAACDGSGRHNFSITFEEHLNNSCE